MKGLIIFDFDGTITTKDTFREFLKFTHQGIPYYTKALRALPHILLYYLRIIREKDLKENILSLFFKDKSSAFLFEKGTHFIDHLIQQEIIKKSFLDLINQYQKEDATILIVSASPDIWVKPFCDAYRLQCICTRLAFTREGLFTGKIAGENCKGPEKRKRILSKYSLQEFNKIAVYGDSDGDLEMMELATEKHWID